jgi:hypothetical protein
MGILHGFDRVRLQGSLRYLYKPTVMEYYLQQAHVLLKDFGQFAKAMSHGIRQAAEHLAQRVQRPIVYLRSSRISKEDLAREIAQRDQIREGLIAVFSAVEPCRTYFVRGNRDTKKLEMRLESGKCIHLYFYQQHPRLGLLHLRLQTWFPFLVQICFNGREWLARQMDAAGMKYRREDNGIPWVADLPAAQALMDRQLETDWVALCEQLLAPCHPHHEVISRPMSLQYYWTVAESEYASDVMFHDQARLQRIYPYLIHHGIKSFSGEQVLRFMRGHSNRAREDDVRSDLRRGPDGVRIKHWLNANSLKLYDKGSLLRPETTINEPRDFRVYRAAESNPQGPKRWRILRRSVADFHRRAAVSRAANERYLTALASVSIRTPLAEEATTVCSPVLRDGRRHRALNPFGEADAQLLTVINRGEFAINGFRNRDLRAHLYGARSTTAVEHKQMAAMSRKLALLRAHGLVSKVSKTHRWLVTPKGRRVISALLSARQADIQQLTELAA